MELLSNLVWLLLCTALLGGTLVGLSNGSTRLPLRSTLLLVALLCLILLPAISLSDDLLSADQADLPVAAQTWRLAMEGAALATDSLLAVALSFSLLLFGLDDRLATRASTEVRVTRPVARWLTRSQRLRPPLALIA